MAKFNLQETDPVRYEEVKAKQNELKYEYRSYMQIARLCPYCNHKIEILLKGEHGATITKCPNCGEEVVFPPISFQIAL